MSNHDLLSADAMSDAARRIAALPDELLYPSLQHHEAMASLFTAEIRSRATQAQEVE